MKKAYYSRILAVMLLNLGLAGCNTAFQDPQLLTGEKTSGAESCDSAELISYVKVQPVFANRCQRCHQAGSGFSVASYTDVFAIKDRIKIQINNNRMPLDGPLTPSDKKLVIDWIDAGAPEVEAPKTNCGSAPVTGPKEPGPVPDPDTTPERPTDPTQPPKVFPATYNGIREKFLEAKCILCHQAGGPGQLYDFSSYSAMMTISEFISEDLFEIEDPEKSEIVRSVRADGRKLMPPTRSKIAPLADEDIALLIEWIRRGVPEN